MNQTSKQLLKLARKNALLFKNHKNVKAIVVTGSVSQGTSDNSSDIDTIVYLTKPFGKKDFDRIVSDAKSSGGGFYHGTAKEGFAVYYYIDGVKCDFGFGTTKELEQMISEMIKKPDTDLTKQLIMSGFMNAITIYGAGWVNKWKAKAAKYPESLAKILIEANLHFYPKWVMEKMCAGRGDIIFFFENIINDIKNMFTILCAVNKMYHPAKLKGMKRTIDLMKIKPRNFMKRCERLFASDSSAAIEDLYKLIDECILLAEKHNPSVNTSRVREIIKMELRK